ncbi:MAG: NYN domain-containing protein [Candidatus Nanoarchaeia archaeon]|nr:NYN domain-containing protein [Candidatus Nanoarchaeia archaeon]MDD5740635.1 NYN domain-containing protein [Candidatus Nanoarchaeia archaeon]
MNKTIVLIDAGFLSKLSRYFGAGKYLIYNLITFSKNLAEKQKLSCEHVYYYTAPPFQSNSPTKEELERYNRYGNFKNKLSKDKIISIREGRCQRLKIDGKFIYGQKGVDSLAIIDLMSIPLEHKEVKKVILIANDSDFVPAVKKLKELNIETILYTYYSKKRKSSFSRSNELLKAVSRYVQLTKEDFDKSKLIKPSK